MGFYIVQFLEGVYLIMREPEMIKPTEAQYLEARQLAKQYRSHYPERSGGAVIIFNGQVAGWAKSFLDTVNCWEPNCIAVDELQTCWLMSDGKSQDGVKIWVQSSYLFSGADTIPVVSGVAMEQPESQQSSPKASFIEFTGQFSLFSGVALVLFCYLVFTGVLPWWSILIAWLYKQDFVQIDLKKMFGKTKI
jgi:hypothetical protein